MTTVSSVKLSPEASIEGIDPLLRLDLDMVEEGGGGLGRFGVGDKCEAMGERSAVLSCQAMLST